MPLSSVPQKIDVILAEFLRNNAVVNFDQYKDVQSESKTSGKSLLTTMVTKGLVNEDAIADNFAKFYGLQKIQINDGTLKTRPLLDKMNDNFVKQNRIIPYQLEGQTLSVIIADPTALNHINELKRVSDYTVKTLVTTIGSFQDYLDSLGSSANSPAAPATTAAAPVAAASPAPAKKEAHMRRGDAAIAADPVTEHATGSHVINFVDFVIEKAISIGASDIHLEIFRDGARLRMRRNGVLQEINESKEFLTHNYSAITTRIKILANLDISERRLPQDGSIAYKLEAKTVDLRASILPTANGERVVMRILDPDSANFSLDQLGIPEDILKLMRKAIHAPQGMILVTGPTGSGKSTTLYAVLKELNHDGVNILTAEDPVEFDLNGVGQVQVRDSIGLSFGAALRSFLRQDPEVIMVGEIRDKDTSDIAIKAALTGHLVLSTLHTNDAPSTITRMVNMGIPAYLITAALRLVVAQRLARVICESCKVEDSHPVETLLGLGFTEAEAKALKVYKGTGCEKCLNSGIKGRRGIYEVLPVSEGLKMAIMEDKTDLEIKKIAQKEGFVTMQEIGRNLIKEGIISVEEYQRILVLD